MLGVIVGGLLSGLALGMLGAGGTIIGLPMILYLGAPASHAAFGTNAFAVAVIAIILLVRRIQRREVDGRLGVVFATPGLAGIAIGARLGLIYPAAKLVFLLSFLILIVAIWIGYLSRKESSQLGVERAHEPPTSLSGRLLLKIVPTAFGVGLISGFLAIGGGVLMVPGLAIAAAVDLRSSARSSLVPIAAFAGPGALEYLAGGRPSRAERHHDRCRSRWWWRGACPGGPSSAASSAEDICGVSRVRGALHDCKTSVRS